ncbi:MAG: dihydroorotase, partial [Planctomycetaceae bacterium]
MRTLIRNAKVVLPESVETVDVMVQDGLIAAIDAAVHSAADEVIDAAGLHLIPGVVDDQVHFREPGLTHKEDLQTATRACARGGVTSFLEMPNTKPATISCDALHAKLALAAGRCLVNYGFYIGATPDNVSDLQEAVGTAEEPLSVPGICGIKIFMGS